MWQIDTELYHYGILGQKWGVRRFQNPDGTLTEEGKKRYGSQENFEKAQKKKEIGKKVATTAGTMAVVAAATIGASYVMNLMRAEKEKAELQKEIDEWDKDDEFFDDNLWEYDEDLGKFRYTKYEPEEFEDADYVDADYIDADYIDAMLDIEPDYIDRDGTPYKKAENAETRDEVRKRINEVQDELQEDPDNEWLAGYLDRLFERLKEAKE